LKSTTGLNKQAITMLHTAFWLHLEPFSSLLAASQMAGNHHVSTIPNHVLNADYVKHYNILLNKKKYATLEGGCRGGEKVHSPNSFHVLIYAQFYEENFPPLVESFQAVFSRAPHKILFLLSEIDRNCCLAIFTIQYIYTNTCIQSQLIQLLCQTKHKAENIFQYKLNSRQDCCQE
jgi:hypothetical protein